MIRRLLPFLVLLVVIFGLAHYFVFVVTANSLAEEGSARFIYAMILTIGLFSMPLGFAASHAKVKRIKIFTWIGYIWMGFFSNLFFFSLFEFIIFVFFPHDFSYWVIAASFVIGLWALCNGMRLPRVFTHTLEKTALKGLKLAQISDLHIGMLHLNAKWLEKVVDRILPLGPDIVVITGDLVEGDFVDISPQLEILKKLSAIPHKFYITGNHEYIHHTGAWEQRLTHLGFTALHNQNRIINYKGAKVLMAGVPDRSIRRFLRNEDSLPDLALKTSEKTDYKILLAHQPASVFDVKNESCDLILSGHTHGGQIFPFHLIVKMVQPVNAGFKLINNILVFAHRGTGFWGPPMRWFSDNEIVLLEWK